MPIGVGIFGCTPDGVEHSALPCFARPKKKPLICKLGPVAQLGRALGS